jgi:hypothetical protein
LGPLGWAAMSLPVGDMGEIGATVAGRDFMPQDDEEIATPPPMAMAKLLQLHAKAGDLAEQAPQILGRPEAARGLEEALIEAMVDLRCRTRPARR